MDGRQCDNNYCCIGQRQRSRAWGTQLLVAYYRHFYYYYRRHRRRYSLLVLLYLKRDRRPRAAKTLRAMCARQEYA